MVAIVYHRNHQYRVTFCGARNSKIFDWWSSRPMSYGRAVNLKFRIERALKRGAQRKEAQ